jgi:hypothetical protein
MFSPPPRQNHPMHSISAFHMDNLEAIGDKGLRINWNTR